MTETLVFFDADRHPTSLQSDDGFFFEGAPDQGTTLRFERNSAPLLIQESGGSGHKIVSGFVFKKRLSREMITLIARLIAAASGHSIIPKPGNPLAFTLT